ncbi:hypothetical protein EHS25_004007 [Saitozyma podzolica]|uniref:NADP-dependent oxidoreductase domain-containing protein n=1 Tax=Saitozyma podzolica TaxID=1890683 RepID=A0A427YSU4_9TREE|nr:hypothetical protein EHS25_004007 [Saitozyma podzolica]
MPYTPLKSGKKRIILGLMTFGPDKDAGARITSLDEFKSCLDYFQGQGYNEVDTAHSYVGKKQQAFTREAGWKERGLKIATKYYPNDQSGGHTAANIREKCEHNLRELGTDCVDIFYLHAPDRNTNFAEVLEECNKLYKEGKFKQLGLTRNLDIETVVACRRYGIDIVVYNPLAGGLFSGKVKSKDHLPEDEHSRFGAKSSAGANYRARYFKDATFEALAMVEEVAAKHNLSVIEIALRWVMHHSALNVAKDGGDGIIIGVSSQAQLEDNLKNLEKGPLPDEVVQVLDQAWLHTKAVAPPYWHGTLKYTYDTQAALFGK